MCAPALCGGARARLSVRLRAPERPHGVHLHTKFPCPHAPSVCLRLLLVRLWLSGCAPMWGAQAYFAAKVPLRPWHLQDVPPPVQLFSLAEVLTHLTPYLLPSGESLPSLTLAHVYRRLGPHAFPRSLVNLPLLTPLLTLKPSWMFTLRLKGLTIRYMNYFSLGKTIHNYYKN
ncbi:unnamed protein product, partial [Citrullus colocynthis]